MDETDRTCPMCAAEQSIFDCAFGQLGVIFWLRCRFCGWEWGEPMGDE